jgi:glyoxylase-like metal-dependent hydrolase (beta-lactamase superfamily II)
MPCFICITCGTQFAPTEAAPSACPICDDERQYVTEAGQRWTTSAAMHRTHFNAWRLHEPNLLGIGTTPSFAIGQRALLLLRPDGNILWDCISLLDAATIALVKSLGGISKIAISHPHYYGNMIDWADAFDATIWIHEGDRDQVMRPDPRIHFWSGETHPFGDGLTLINAPGHFDGATMLHWADGAEGRGALLSGDIFQVVPDRRFVSFMRSYPNLIPLPASALREMERRTAPFAYARIYGAWWDRIVPEDAKAAVARSMARYLKWISA